LVDVREKGQGNIAIDHFRLQLQDQVVKGKARTLLFRTLLLRELKCGLRDQAGKPPFFEPIWAPFSKGTWESPVERLESVKAETWAREYPLFTQMLDATPQCNPFQATLTTTFSPLTLLFLSSSKPVSTRFLNVP
jgi:hypothetical protein